MKPDALNNVGAPGLGNAGSGVLSPADPTLGVPTPTVPGENEYLQSLGSSMGTVDDVFMPAEREMVAAQLIPPEIARGILKRSEEIQGPVGWVHEEADDAVSMGLVDKYIKREGFPSSVEKYAANINTDRIADSDDMLASLDFMAGQLKSHGNVVRRGEIAQEQTRRLADELGMSEEDLLARPVGEAWNAERIMAARMLFANSRMRVEEMAEAIRAGEATTEVKVKFREELSRYAGMMLQVEGLAAEAGRALGAHRMVVAGGEYRPGRGLQQRNPSRGELRARELDDMIHSMGGEDTIDALARMVIDMRDNPRQLGKAIKEVDEATTTGMVREYWINGLLSAPSTHGVNVTSTAAFQVWSMVERAYAGARFSGDEIVAEESMAMLYGGIEGMRDAFKAFAHVLRTAEPIDAATKVDLPPPQITADGLEQSLGPLKRLAGADSVLPEWAKGPVNMLGSFLRLPSRFLMAEDEFMKTIAYRMELRRNAYRTAREEAAGWDPTALEASVAGDGDAFVKRRTQELVDELAPLRGSPEQVWKRTVELNDDTLQRMHVESNDFAREVTFTNKSDFATAWRKWSDKTKIGWLITPFITTPTNIAARTFERTPLALLSKEVRQKIAAGGAEGQMTQARIELSSMVGGVLAMTMAESEHTGNPFAITGMPSGDWKKNATLQRMGWQPYSLKVGDTYHAFNRLDPLGWTLGMIVDFKNLAGAMWDSGQERNIADDTHGDRLMELSSAITLAISANVMNKTYMRGIADFMEMFTSFDPEQGVKYMERFAASFVPMSSLQRNTNRWMDPHRRHIDGLYDRLCATTVGCSTDLPPLRDLWGRPKSPASGVFIYSSKEDAQPADEAFLELGYHPAAWRMQIKGVELTPEQLDEYRAQNAEPLGQRGSIAGIDLKNKNLLQAMNALVKTKAYQNAHNWVDVEGGKKGMIDTLLDVYKAKAQAHMLERHPEILQRVKDIANATQMAQGNDRADDENIRKLMQGEK